THRPEIKRRFSLRSQFQQKTIPTHTESTGYIFISEPIGLSLKSRKIPTVSLPNSKIRQPSTLVYIFYQNQIRLPNKRLETADTIHHLHQPFVRQCEAVATYFINLIHCLFHLI